MWREWKGPVDKESRCAQSRGLREKRKTSRQRWEAGVRERFDRSVMGVENESEGWGEWRMRARDGGSGE